MGDGDDSANTCPVCERTWTVDEDDPVGWVHLEVTRAADDGEPDWISEIFCSQEHAAEWLQHPLPESAPLPPYRMTSRDRLVGVALALAVGSIVGLAGLGFLTVVRFVVDRV